ncbi:molybdopterin oxidoreductase [Caballeronia hypogeia]|uniref:Molybdopterin oxidoreductase n=1 Tax=Caballeronia hypogeia TaxID=1777140 RepID=A0A158BWI9_9BURK|nr:molybdopterin-dependent oxidoreductase [Caballeronia hypogeia]SAK74474.1 molybdopterin oxidoreductase [Caballeronia hypogeia]
MKRFTLSHWGIYEGEQDGTGALRLRPYANDPDPSPIGVHQTARELRDLRVRRPAIRKSWLEGGAGTSTHLRGREAFVEVEWDEALDLVGQELDRVRARFGNSAIFGGSYGWGSAGRFHHAQSQIHRFLNMIGGYVRHQDSYSLGAAHVIMPHVVDGMNELISYHHSWDVLAEHCQLFVSFGGVPAKNSQSAPGGVGRHRVSAGLKAMREAGVRFINIGPVSDNIETGGPVEWIQCRPGTDTALMLGIASELHRRKLHDVAFLTTHCVGYDEFERYLVGATDGVPKTAAWAEGISGVPSGVIQDLALGMHRCRTVINVAWSLQRAHHGEQPFWMVVTLAAMLGQIGLPGGGFGVGYGCLNTVGTPHEKLGGPTLSQGRNAVKDFIPVARIADLLLKPGEPFQYDGKQYRYPDIRLVYWAGGNPFHHHQDINRFLEAWRKPDTIVVHEQYWTATARHADIVLPISTSIERDDLGYASQEAILLWMAKMTEPVGEARDDFTVFAQLAARLGVAEAFTENRDPAQWLEHMYDDTRERYASAGIDLPVFDAFRERGLVDLHDRARSVVMLDEFRRDPSAAPVNTPSGRIELYSQTVASFDLRDCPGHACWIPPVEYLGAPQAADFPLHLLSDQPRNKLHSQLDGSPLSAGGKLAGREPIYMHPSDAAQRGIATGDIVEVFNARGRCLAGAVVSDAIMAGVVRMSTGAWYDPEPGSGRDKHGNPNVLTADIPASELSQGCAAQSCLVQVSAPVQKPPPVTAFDLPRFSTDRPGLVGIRATGGGIE